MKQIFAALRRHALAYPETREDQPWGESAIKVKGKTFLFMRCDPDGLGLSVKLPQSHPYALDQPFAERTRYGLGNSGWITASFGPRDQPPLDLLKGWIDESYRAVAPKKTLSGAKSTQMDKKKTIKVPAKVNRSRRTAH
jgi:predicted DNA-binding protein (MmcQ/YjbR family)